MRLTAHRWTIGVLSTFMLSIVAVVIIHAAHLSFAADMLLFAISCIAAGLLYVTSHAMRATRLAVISMPLLGIGFRSAILLHFFVAPWSLFMPAKLDEFIRLNELRTAGRTWTRAILALLLDRSMDGVILIALSLVLLTSGRPAVAQFTGILGIGLTVLAISLATLPTLLEAVQRHIFINHYRDRSFETLKLAAGLRAMLSVSRRAIGDTLPFLAFSTIAIWALEYAAIAAILVPLRGARLASLDIVETMLTRAGDGWRALLLGSQPDSASTLLSFVFFAALALLWLAVLPFYGKRIALEPQRPRLPKVSTFSFSRQIER